MKNYLLTLLLMAISSCIYTQVELHDIEIETTITKVQPMTGIVFWHNSGNNETDAISLEFSYMLFNDIVADSGQYDWSAAETILNAIASRGHQAIFRFRYVYPGWETSVPNYIKDLPDYNETIGESEGHETHFPDWTHPELRRFTLEFYTKFAEKYDNDPRLAFIQVGFGLWGEYHIYDGPFELGVTFPSKAFQEEFFYHLDETFDNIPWSISIDAADNTYSPFEDKPELLELKFGNFDDSFMHQNHSGYNESSWNFFDRIRYKESPAGGEFSYYSNYDQQHVLDIEGPYGTPWEDFAKAFHITYMIGNDQPRYQTMERIEEASKVTGYKFKIDRIQTGTDTSIFEIQNFGVAPFYYDAYITVNGIRSQQSLKLHAPGEIKTYSVSANADDAVITIESDKLVDGQVIQFYGTQDFPENTGELFREEFDGFIYPNPVQMGSSVYFAGINNDENIKYSIYNNLGMNEFSFQSKQKIVKIDTKNLKKGIYYLNTEKSNFFKTYKLIII